MTAVAYFLLKKRAGANVAQPLNAHPLTLFFDKEYDAISTPLFGYTRSTRHTALVDTKAFGH
ncbi:MAG: hypothetical protein R2788_00725 [Saprospiraceae bacterium]